MNQVETQKQAAAEAAISYIEDNIIVGVGTGSTVHYFIEALAKIKSRIEAAISSSNDTTEKLKSCGIPVIDLNVAGTVPLYVDGADEVNAHLQMIKGGGGALTREKIIAHAATRFICIAHESKKVEQLGEFPIALEVIPMARSFVGREIVKLGGDPVYRQGFLTDNGNIILDVYQLDLSKPMEMEAMLNQIPGVVCHGLFAKRSADILLLGTSNGVISFP